MSNVIEVIQQPAPIVQVVQQPAMVVEVEMPSGVSSVDAPLTYDPVTQRLGFNAAQVTDLPPSATTGTAVVDADPRLTNARTPTAHKSTHATGGSDALTPADIGAEPAGTSAAGMASHLAASDPHPQYTTTAEAAAAAPVQSVAGKTGAVTLAPADVGADAAGTAAAAVAAHEAAADPHTQYTTAARVRAVVLTGLSTAVNAAIAATDTILAALGKLQAQLTAHVGTGGTAHAEATTSTAGFMSGSDKTKLDGIAAGATANSSDAQLRDRATHTGAQAISTVTGLQTALDGKEAVGAATNSMATHLAAADPHSQYTTAAEAAAAAPVQSVAGRTGTVTLAAADISDSTAAGRAVLTAADAAAQRTALGLAIGTQVQAFDADLSAIAALAGTSGLLRKTAADTWALETAAYLTGNQSISVTGDATGSGATSIALTLAASGVTAGTYRSVTVDAKGRVTGGTNPTTLAGYGITDAQPLDADLTAIAALTHAADNFLVSNGSAWVRETPAEALVSLGLGTPTGAGNVVRATSPTLTTPNLGTPSAVTLTNATGLPIAGITGLGTGVGTALAVNVGTAGAFVVNGGALGTPASGVVTNLTGTASININGTVGATTPTTGAFTALSASGTTTLSGLTASQAVFTDASKNLVSVATTGTGNAVLATGPTITTLTTVGILANNNSVRVTNGFANVSLLESATGPGYRWTLVSGTGQLLLQRTANGLYTDAVTSTVFTSAYVGIGSLNTQAWAASSVAGGAAFSWNRSNGNAEMNIVNQFDNASLSFEFAQKTGASTASVLYSFGTTSHQWYTGGSERMRIDSAGNVGIGTTSPSTWGKFAVVDSNSGSTVVAAIVNTAGTADTQAVLSFDTTANGFNVRDAQIRSRNSGANATTLEFYTAEGSAPTEKMRISANGNVGIGTVSPGSLLHLRKASGAADIRLQVDTTLHATWYASAADTTIGSVSAIPLIFLANNTERMRITSAGSVGIGTANPVVLLDVNGAGRFIAGATLGSQSVAGNVQLGIYSGSSTGTFLTRYSGANAVAEIRHYGTSGFQLVTHDAADILFYTNNTDRMRINSAGNVGIGAAFAPAYRLHVEGGYSAIGAFNTQTWAASNGNGGAAFSWNRSAGGAEMNIVNLYDNAPLSFEFAQKTGASTASVLYSFGTSNHLWYTSGSERMRITSAGNVGIGTTAPGTLFQVSDGVARLNYSNTYNATSWFGTSGVGFNCGRTAADTWSFVGDSANNGGALIDAVIDGTIRFFGRASSGGGSVTLTDAQMLATERMRITAAGNVAIGTTTTGGRLTVRGSGTSSSTTGLLVEDSAGTDNFTIRDDGAYAFRGGTVGLAQTGYTTFTNLTTDRTCDADTVTVAELADIVGTLIVDLKTKGIIAT